MMMIMKMKMKDDVFGSVRNVEFPGKGDSPYFDIHGIALEFIRGAKSKLGGCAFRGGEWCE
jgi:hypothetical protein